MNCPYCNGTVPFGATNCPSCGAKIQQQQPSDMANNSWQQQAPTYPKWMPLTSLILGAVSFVFSLGLDENDLEDEDTLLGAFIIIGIPAILALVFGIISLAKKYPQKTLSIIGVVLGALALLI